MAYIDQVKVPGGSVYDLQGIEYIVGTQTAATNAWTGKTKSAELYTGKAIIYKLPQAGNSSAATLNLTLSGGGTTGAKAVQRLNNGGITTHYPANSVLFLVYDGDRWRHDAEYDSTIDYQLRSAYSTYLTSATLYRYQLLLQKNETTLIPVSNGNNSTTTGKTITTEQFDPFGEIYYYNSTNTIAANTAIPTWTLYQQVNRNLSYAFNTTNTLTTNKDVYLVATPTTTGKAKLYSTPTTQALPTSDNGLIYIYLGHASANTNVEIHPVHPVYWYKNGAIVPWDPNGLKSVTRSGTTWTFTRYNGATSTVAQQDNNSTYSLTQDSSDKHKLIWKGSGVTQTTYTIPDNNTTYVTMSSAEAVAGTAVADRVITAANLTAYVKNSIVPIGSILVSTSSTSPGKIGTWENIYSVRDYYIGNNGNERNYFGYYSTEEGFIFSVNIPYLQQGLQACNISNLSTVSYDVEASGNVVAGFRAYTVNGQSNSTVQCGTGGGNIYFQVRSMQGNNLIIQTGPISTSSYTKNYNSDIGTKWSLIPTSKTPITFMHNLQKFGSFSIHVPGLNYYVWRRVS